jgi:hypothetical protein
MEERTAQFEGLSKKLSLLLAVLRNGLKTAVEPTRVKNTIIRRIVKHGIKFNLSLSDFSANYYDYSTLSPLSETDTNNQTDKQTDKSKT